MARLSRYLKHASVAQLAGGISLKTRAVWVRIPPLVPKLNHEAPDLNELLSQFLTEECDLTATHNINFWSYWLMSSKHNEVTWVCDVHADSVRITRGPTISCYDPDFMPKFRNAIRHAISTC